MHVSDLRHAAALLHSRSPLTGVRGLGSTRKFNRCPRRGGLLLSIVSVSYNTEVSVSRKLNHCLTQKVVHRFRSLVRWVGSDIAV